MKEALVIVVNPAGFSMHRVWRSDRFAAEGFIDTLHSQAHGKDRYFVIKGSDQCCRYAGMGRIARARADEDIVRFQPADLIEGNVVAPVYDNVQIVAHEHLHEIIGK